MDVEESTYQCRGSGTMPLTNPQCLLSLKKEEIPKDIGLFAFIEKESGQMAYIGTATSKNGLYQRIWNQHLNPKYLEVRKEVFTELDIYQLEHPIYHNDQVAIDKSTFRRKIARRYLLKAGEESVQFIRENFLLFFAVFPPDEHESVLTQSQWLIQLHKPFYNGRLSKKVIQFS